MGIKIEFNPDLALRNINEYKKGRRKRAECIPAKIVKGQVYDFLKKEQRNYWLCGEVPLIETKGNEELSRPKAIIRILRATHFLEKKEIYTKGKFKVVKLIEDDKIYFECFDPVGKRK